MTEQTDQTPAQPGAVPVRIELEDLIEAIARSISRAWVEPDDVGGYALRPVTPSGGGVVIYYPPVPWPVPLPPVVRPVRRG